MLVKPVLFKGQLFQPTVGNSWMWMADSNYVFAESKVVRRFQTAQRAEGSAPLTLTLFKGQLYLSLPGTFL